MLHPWARGDYYRVGGKNKLRAIFIKKSKYFTDMGYGFYLYTQRN